MTQKDPTSQDFAEFRFNPESLSKPRKPGISAYMRIKNEEQFVALAILSHIDYYDEIIACYNDCTDNTEKILRELAAQHPKKIKVYHYLPKVPPIGSEAHRNSADDSVHSIANHCNYALSKTTYSVAIKLDADHLAIAQNLAPVIATIRRDIAAGKKKLYLFSGINLACEKVSGIGVFRHELFFGNGDHQYHPVEASAFFCNDHDCERFNNCYQERPEKQYMGIVYFHLKYLKGGSRSVIPFDQFRTAALRSRRHYQRKRFSNLRYFLYRNTKYLQLKNALNGKYPQFAKMREFMLADDLKGIDFERDVTDRLDGVLTEKEVATQEFAEFRFNPESLSKPRKPGISAYMRIKNEEQFVALAILSHIDHYDEIIACYNDCTDNTEKILRQLAAQYPKKIKVYHYLPKVHPIGSQGHRDAADDSVHGMANYYNYALSKTTYSVATKLDADHLAIDCNLAPLIATIRRDLAAGKKKIYLFSGINLFRGKGLGIGVAGQNLFAGIGDHHYHPVEAGSFYRNIDFCERFNEAYEKQLENKYMGIVYFHLRYLKKDFGFSNYPAEIPAFHAKESVSKWSAVSYDKFRTDALRRERHRQRKRFRNLRYFLYRIPKYLQLKYVLTGKCPGVRQMREFTLPDNLKGIDFERDAIDRLVIPAKASRE